MICFLLSVCTCFLILLHFLFFFFKQKTAYEMRISDWSSDVCSSDLTFATADASLAAAFGPVTGLTTTLTFDDLIGLKSAPGQIAKIKEINPGIPVIDGEIEYRLLGDNRVRIEGGSWPFGGGKLLLQDRKSTRLNSSH